MHRSKHHSMLSKSYKRSKCPRCDVAGHEARQVWVQKNIKFDPLIDIFSVKMTVFWILFFSDALRRDRNNFPYQLFACSSMVWFIKTWVDENNLQDSSKISPFSENYPNFDVLPWSNKVSENFQNYSLTLFFPFSIRHYYSKFIKSNPVSCNVKIKWLLLHILQKNKIGKLIIFSFKNKNK